MDNQIFYKILSGNNELENTINEIDTNKNNINQPLNNQEPSQEQIKQVYLKLQKIHHSLNSANNILNDITKETDNSYSNKKLIDIFQRIKKLNERINFKLWGSLREAEKNAMHDHRHQEADKTTHPFTEAERQQREALMEWAKELPSCIAVTLNTNLLEDNYSLPSLKKKLGRCLSTYRNLSLGAKRGKVEFFGSVEGLDSKPHFHLLLMSPVFENNIDLSLIHKEEKKLTEAWKAIFPGGSVFMEKITDPAAWIEYVYKHKESLNNNMIIDEETAESSFLKNNSSATFKPIRVLSNDPCDKSILN